MAPPIVQLDAIPLEGLSLDLTLEHGWLRDLLEPTGAAPAGDRAQTASVRLDLQGREVLVSGSLHLTLQAPCVACLEPVQFPVGQSFQLLLEPAAVKNTPARPGEEVELTADELDTDTYTDDKIDLGHWLREQVLLETPVHPRHAGECPAPLNVPETSVAGRGSAVDPRLAVLKTINLKKE
ncbi:MAG: DUF177 domain-containing protein [Deltaproteobacteria bacterium]|nr:DUF177 domain-containing protein [Deltaproteobacteria bacterium]